MTKKLCSLALVLSLIPWQTHAASSLVITEIAAFETSPREWIEIYNRGGTPIDLTGYKFWEENSNHSIKLFQGEDLILEPQEYAVICNDCQAFTAAYTPPSDATLIDSSWSSLQEQGELLGIKDAQGTVIESFLSLPSSKGSLQRLNTLIDNYTENNWTVTEETHSLLKPYTPQIPPAQVIEESILPETPEESVVYLDDNFVKTSPTAKAMVLLLTPAPASLPELIQGDHTFKPYKLMLYYLDSYTGLDSIQDYLSKLTQAFDQQMIQDNPADHVQEIAEEIPLEELKEDPLFIPEVFMKETTTDPVIPEIVSAPQEVTAPVEPETDEVAKTCMAWWEKNHQIINP